VLGVGLSHEFREGESFRVGQQDFDIELAEGLKYTFFVFSTRACPGIVCTRCQVSPNWARKS
jgi:hypothetical protein